MGGQAGYIFAVENNFARRWDVVASDNIEGCGFARTIRTDQTGDFSGWYSKAAIIDGDYSAEPHSDVVELNHAVVAPKILVALFEGAASQWIVSGL